MAFQGDELDESTYETPEAQTGEPQEQETSLPNPFEMTPEERRQWLAAASPEEKAAAVLTYADPDDVVLSTAHLRAEKGKLGQERQELKRQQEMILSLLAQAQQPQMQQQQQQSPPPEYPQVQQTGYYDPYAIPDPAQERLNAIERQVQALNQTLQQQQQRQAQEEGARLIREEMQKLSQEFPFFVEADYPILFAEMQRRNNPSATAVFWQLYEQQAVEHKLASAARPRQGAPTTAPPEATTPPTRGKGTATPIQPRTLGTPEEFAADLIKAGYVSPNLDGI